MLASPLLTRPGAVDSGRAAVNRAQGLDHFQRCGLSRAVRAENTEDLALFYFKANALDDLSVAVLLAKFVDFNNCTHTPYYSKRA